MKNPITKTIIFVPIALNTFAALSFFKQDMQGYFTLFFTLSCFVAVAFYYAITFLINDETNNFYIGCVLTLQKTKYHCFCGSDATMFLAENEKEDTKIIIQCNKKDCGTSVQGDSISRAEKGWDALCH